MESQVNLSHWSPENQRKILQAIESAKDGNPHPFAVFDADNTVWKHDLIEALLAWMGNKKQLRLTALSPDIVPMPIRSDETLQSYYDYLSDIDHSLAYLFASQIFAGFTLAELQQAVHDMLDSIGPITVPMPNGQSKDIPIPKIFPAQIELMHTLQDNGVEVWIVSASLEEVVRMVASNPRFGLALPPERVIGVNLMLRKPNGEVTVGALERREGRIGLEYFFSEDRLSWTLGTYPFTPLTWYGGKLAAIQEWIDPSQRPILVAGDSPNDFYMQFYADVKNDGIRLRIHRNNEHLTALNTAIQQRTKGNGNDLAAEGWMTVTVEDLGLPD